MSGTFPKAKRVRVQREQGEGGWFYATSPDLKGLLVTQPTLDALDQAIPQAITDLYLACGESVIVTRLDEDEDHLHGWVAVPAAVASQALAKIGGAGSSR